jgi:hypothetical protein
MKAMQEPSLKWCIRTQWEGVRYFYFNINPLNAELNPICHLLALLGGAAIVVVSRLRVKYSIWFKTYGAALSSNCTILLSSGDGNTLCTCTATTFNSVLHLHIGLHIYWFTIIVSGICKMELRTSDLNRSFGMT